MNNNHKKIIDYIIKVFEPGDRYIDILNDRTLTIEEVVLLFNEIEKDRLNAQFEQILTDNENVLERLKTRGDDYYFSREFIEKTVNEFMGQVNTEHE